MATSTHARWRFLAPFALLGLLAGSVLTGARPATPAHSPVTLTVWWANWGVDFDNLMVQATDSHSIWHKLHPNITVKWTFYTNLQQKLLTAIAAGAPPDMTYINALQGQAWAQKGVLTPLDSYFKAAHLEKRQFVPASFPPYEYNGHLYALLNSGNFLAILWNKDLFKAAGLDPNRPPRTIQELEAYNAKLFKFKNGRIVQAGLFVDLPPQAAPSSEAQALATWGLQFGGEFVDRKHHKITANDPHIVAALAWMLKQSKKYGQVNEDRFYSTLGSASTPQDPFYKGKIAMEWQGDWDFYTEAKYAPKVHVGVAALPTAGHGLRLWDDNNWATAIPKGSAHPKEAWELMQYLTTGPQAPKVIADTINFLEYKPLVPAFFKETYRIMGPKNPMRQDFHVFQDTIMPHTVAQPYYDIPVSSVYDQELSRAVDSVLHGKDTPKHALDVVTQRVQHAWDTFSPSS